MSCNKECTQQQTCSETSCGQCGSNNGFVFLIVLYILLVIILGSFVCY